MRIDAEELIGVDEMSKLRGDVLGRSYDCIHDMIEHAERLKRRKRLRHAREILEEALRFDGHDAALRRRRTQQLALFVYRDPAIASAGRAARALDLLLETDCLNALADRNPTTLSMAGDVFKMGWELERLKSRAARQQNDAADAPFVCAGRHLDELRLAVRYYLNGHRRGGLGDYGYAALNAAYVSDALSCHASSREDVAGALRLRAQAAGLRAEVAEGLAALGAGPRGETLVGKWWFLLSLAEAHMGRGEYAEALRWVEKACKLRGVAGWCYTAAAWRLFDIAELRRDAPSETQLKIYFELAKRLKANNAFPDARRILKMTRAVLSQAESRGLFDEPGLRLKLAQQHALCTYKDPDLPLDRRLDRAVEILGEVETLAATTDQETLGIAGAICKRKWEVDGRKQNLERALHYYCRGYEQGDPSSPEYDCGYTGINAAFVLDVLAGLEEGEAVAAGGASEVAGKRRGQARAIAVEANLSFGLKSSRQQLLILKNLGLRPAEVDAAIGVLDEALKALGAGEPA